MNKTFALLLVAAFALPTTAFASSPIYNPGFITEEKARNIVSSWGISVSYAELSYEGDRAFWNVYGKHTVTLGPARINVNVLVKLEATNGQFVSLEIKRRDIDYDQSSVLEKMKGLGVEVTNIQLVRGYAPYWDIQGYKMMSFDGYTLNVELYIRVDARTGTITQITTRPIYDILSHEDPMPVRPWYGAIAERVSAVTEAIPTTVPTRSPIVVETDSESDVEVQ